MGGGTRNGVETEAANLSVLQPAAAFVFRTNETRYARARDGRNSRPKSREADTERKNKTTRMGCKSGAEWTRVLAMAMAAFFCKIRVLNRGGFFGRRHRDSKVVCASVRECVRCRPLDLGISLNAKGSRRLEPNLEVPRSKSDRHPADWPGAGYGGRNGP